MYPCATSSTRELKKEGTSLTSNVHQEEQRNLPLGAQLNEMGGFQGRRRKQNPVVGDYTDFVSMDMCKSLNIG